MSPVWQDRGWGKPGTQKAPPERNLVAEHSESLARVRERVRMARAELLGLVRLRSYYRHRLHILRQNVEQHGTAYFRRGHISILSLQEKLAKLDREIAGLRAKLDAGWI